MREEMGKDFKLIGVGGVTTPDDYKRLRDAGADVVMSATGAMWNTDLAKEIKNA
jgi:dihydroorotate dehydrogenase